MLDTLAAAIIAMSSLQLAPVDTTSTIQEDDPRWDCRVDGNQVCGAGAVLPDGSLAVPGFYGQR